MASERTTSPSGTMRGSSSSSLESQSNAVDVLLSYKYIAESDAIMLSRFSQYGFYALFNRSYSEVVLGSVEIAGRGVILRNMRSIAAVTLMAHQN